MVKEPLRPWQLLLEDFITLRSLFGGRFFDAHAFAHNLPYIDSRPSGSADHITQKRTPPPAAVLVVSHTAQVPRFLLRRPRVAARARRPRQRLWVEGHWSLQAGRDCRVTRPRSKGSCLSFRSFGAFGLVVGEEVVFLWRGYIT